MHKKAIEIETGLFNDWIRALQKETGFGAAVHV